MRPALTVLAVVLAVLPTAVALAAQAAPAAEALLLSEAVAWTIKSCVWLARLARSCL
ncbi:hypothetical protein GCM10023086_58460 [Streptomyces venetus]|uniref:Uncharacterized protein n=1 Tax=Streptomyces venetus TaxID=1701086 RepID=A0ABP8GT85_9ACTN